MLLSVCLSCNPHSGKEGSCQRAHRLGYRHVCWRGSLTEAWRELVATCWRVCWWICWWVSSWSAIRIASHRHHRRRRLMEGGVPKPWRKLTILEVFVFPVWTTSHVWLWTAAIEGYCTFVASHATMHSWLCHAVRYWCLFTAANAHYDEHHPEEDGTTHSSSYCARCLASSCCCTCDRART